jgi:hypothetical protein
MRICLPKFGITTRDLYVSVEEAWVAHKANFKPGLFQQLSHSTKLLLLSFWRRSRPSQTFSRLTTCLGALGQHLAVYEASPPRVTNATKIASQSSNSQVLTKRILSTHHLGFLTNHKILTKREWRELTKAYDECISWVAPAPSKGGRGKVLYLSPKNQLLETSQ